MCGGGESLYFIHSLEFKRNITQKLLYVVFKRRLFRVWLPVLETFTYFSKVLVSPSNDYGGLEKNIRFRQIQYSCIWSLWLKSLQYYNHFQYTIANQRWKPLGRCWSRRLGSSPSPSPLPLFPYFPPFPHHFTAPLKGRRYQAISTPIISLLPKKIAYDFKFWLAIKI